LPKLSGLLFYFNVKKVIKILGTCKTMGYKEVK